MPTMRPPKQYAKNAVEFMPKLTFSGQRKVKKSRRFAFSRRESPLQNRGLAQIQIKKDNAPGC